MNGIPLQTTVEKEKNKERRVEMSREKSKNRVSLYQPKYLKGYYPRSKKMDTKNEAMRCLPK